MTTAEKLVEQMCDRIQTFGVAFVRHGKSAGSGTLVQVDGAHGILTAFHVVDQLGHGVPTSLVVGQKDSDAPVDLKYHDHLRLKIDYAPGADCGPDLGLVMLPTDVVSSIKRIAGFYDLTLEPRRSTMERQPPELATNAVWFLDGCADAFGVDHRDPSGQLVAREVVRTIFGVAVRDERIALPHDYITAGPIYGGRHNPPASFAGCSGGGLWRVTIVEGAAPDIETLQLSGVAYWERAAAPGQMELLCHGRRSIYGVAVDAYRHANSSQSGWG